MRNQFNLSHEHKTSVEMGQLIPVLCEEVLPGDTFIHSASALARVAPLQHPLMHRVELRMHTFYVPNRILWSGWEDFITGVDDVTEKPQHQIVAATDKVYDYMGVPLVEGLTVDELPLRAYNMIWNEFYRDQDLQTERAQDDATLARCAWQKDYFTIARPSPQQGAPEAIPLTGNGFIQKTNNSIGNELLNVLFDTNQTPPGRFTAQSTVSTGEFDPLEVDLTNATMTVDDLRRSIALQRFAEARMRFGSRYVDYLRYIGVNPSDGRLDRPEYLGGGKEILSFSEVLSTADTTDATVGDMYGHGIGMGQHRSYRKMFEEHGWVLTLLSARPKTVYQNNVPRKFLRSDAMSFWQKELEVLPWQEVSQIEVHAAGDESAIWGYVPRYEEYRHGVSRVSGTLRGGTENDWHMAREFATPPALNGSFIECTPTDRVYQDSNMPDLIINVMHNLRAARFVGQSASMGTDL